MNNTTLKVISICGTSISILYQDLVENRHRMENKKKNQKENKKMVQRNKIK